MQLEDLAAQVSRLNELVNSKTFSALKCECQPRLELSRLKSDNISTKTDNSQKLMLKLNAIKRSGGLTLRVRNIRNNESLTDFHKAFGSSTTMLEAKTGRLPVVVSHSRKQDLSLRLVLKRYESKHQLDESRNQSRVEDTNLENLMFTNDPMVSQLLQNQFYPKEKAVDNSDARSDL